MTSRFNWRKLEDLEHEDLSEEPPTSYSGGCGRRLVRVTRRGATYPALEASFLTTLSCEVGFSSFGTLCDWVFLAADLVSTILPRSEERRVGKECLE